MKGITLTELIVTIAIVCIIGVAITTTNNNNVSMGVNGLVETRCINGLQFVVGKQGRSTQVMDTNGRGVFCTVK